MPSDQAPTEGNEPNRPAATPPDPGNPVAGEQPRPLESASESGWARLREGIWIAILVHLALLSMLTWIPKYVFKVPLVVDRSNDLNRHKDFTYLDTPLQAPKVAPKR